MPENKIPEALWPIRDRVQDLRTLAQRASRDAADARLRADLYQQEAWELDLVLAKVVDRLAPVLDPEVPDA